MKTVELTKPEIFELLKAIDQYAIVIHPNKTTRSLQDARSKLVTAMYGALPNA